MYQLATTSISQSEYKYLSFHTLHVWFYILQTVPWGTSGNYALFVFAGQCLHVWETFGRRITLITSGPCISWDGRPTGLTQASRWDTVLLRRYEEQKKSSFCKTVKDIDKQVCNGVKARSRTMTITVTILISTTRGDNIMFMVKLHCFKCSSFSLRQSFSFWSVSMI